VPIATKVLSFILAREAKLVFIINLVERELDGTRVSPQVCQRCTTNTWLNPDGDRYANYIIDLILTFCTFPI
jgi:hypothetical protein